MNGYPRKGRKSGSGPKHKASGGRRHAGSTSGSGRNPGQGGPGRNFQEPRRMPPTINSMLELLRMADIKLNKEQVSQLWKFHNLLRARNNDRELTRIIGFEHIIVKHYIDCMVVGKHWNLPSPIVDVGTGAGFPGIPLKIRYPHLKLTLAEPRPKKLAFLKEVCHELRFRNVDIFEHKVVSRSFQTPMKAVITRAVETIDKTLLRTSGCLEVGGQLIFMKGPAVDPEILNAEKRFGDYFKLIADKRYNLPITGHGRRLVVFEKIKNLDETTKTNDSLDES